MKNIEKIRKMAAEELAHNISDNESCDVCAYQSADSCIGKKCEDGIGLWLEREAVALKTLKDVFLERNPGAPINQQPQNSKLQRLLESGMERVKRMQSMGIMMNADALAECFYDTFIGEDREIKWQPFPDEGDCGGGYYDYYYAEDELYIVRDRIVGSMYFTKARSPKKAYENYCASVVFPEREEILREEDYECENNEID